MSGGTSGHGGDEEAGPNRASDGRPPIGPTAEADPDVAGGADAVALSQGQARLIYAFLDETHQHGGRCHPRPDVGVGTVGGLPLLLNPLGPVLGR